MADLKLRIITDISQSQKELNKEVGSVNSLANALISTGKEGDKLINALERDLYLAASKAGNGLKSLQEQAKIVDKTFARLKVGVAETDDTYKAVAQASEYLHQQIDILTEAEKEATAAKKAHNEAMEKALALQKSLANIQSRTQGSVDFLSVTGGSEIEIAQAQLRGYEQTLHELIAAKGLENEETKKAIVAYNDQKDTVERLKQAQESLAVSVRQTVKENEKLPSSFTKLLSVAKNILKFQLLMGPITSVVRGIKTTLSDSVKLAAEAEQRFSKLATVFDGFGDSAKRMAQSLASAIGVANSTAASALSTVGDLLQAQGMGTGESLSTASEWVRAFQDIIAFKDINMSLEEFAQNFMSGAAGNLRNFRTFGSIVKESAVQAELAKKGLDKLTGSQLELAKMTTRAEMALSQQANAMGATKREWDTMLSVNRRLNEEWKQFKENLGDTINKALKPAKAWWTEILQETNKATKAAQQYANGLKDIQVYDINNNKKDAENYQSTLRNILAESSSNLSSMYDMRGTSLSFSRMADQSLRQEERDIIRGQLENINAVIVQFGSSVYQAQQILGDSLPKAAYEELKALEELRKAELRRAKEIESRRAAIEGVASSYDTFIETIKAITGVNISTPDWASVSGQFAYAEGGDNLYAKNIADSLMRAVADSVKSITSSDLSVWGETISGALDELNGAELRQGMADSLKSLFEQAWNLYQQGNLDKASLEKVRTSYLDAKTALEQYNKALEAQKNLLTTLTSSRDNIAQRAGMARFKAQGYDDNIASLMYSMEVAIAEATKMFNEGIAGKTFTSGSSPVLEVGDQFMTLSQILATIRQDYLEQIKAVEESTKAMEKSTASWKKALEQVKESPLFQSIDQFKTDYSTAKTNAMEAGVPEGAATLEGIGMGILGFLATLATQTEVFQEFVNILQPAIETMNNFLKPLEPAILAMSEAISYLVYALLEPLFPVIKIIATVLLTIGTVVSTIAAAVTNVGRGIGNFFRGLFGMEKKQYIDISAIWSEYAERLDAIWNATFEIAQNTKPTNDDTLKAYQEMYQRQMITESEYMALIKGLEGVRYDSMRTAGSYAWNNGRAGTTNVYYGDLKFVIEGTNLSADQIADAVARKIEFRNYTGQYA